MWPVAIVGLLYLFFVAPRLLPAREAQLEDSLRAYLADLTVAPGSALEGVTLRESGLGRDHGLTVVAVRRGEETVYALAGVAMAMVLREAGPMSAADVTVSPPPPRSIMSWA